MFVEFVEFVVNQELCRRQWLDSVQQCAELSVRCDQLQYENDALSTKLKHARFVIMTSEYCGVRTILVLGYYVLGNIHRYWVVSVLTHRGGPCGCSGLL